MRAWLHRDAWIGGGLLLAAGLGTWLLIQAAGRQPVSTRLPSSPIRSDGIASDSLSRLREPVQYREQVKMFQRLAPPPFVPAGK